MSLDDASFVTLLYRVLLGREPDPAGHTRYLGNLKAGDVNHEQVALLFAHSDEFRRKMWLEGAERSQPQERDTDRDWRAIAESFPYFGVLTNETFINPTPEDLVEFFASGERMIDHTLSVIRKRYGDFQPAAALDFGCGVGRLLIPMAKAAGRAVGVDVADRMIELARAHIAQSGVNATATNEIPANDTFDWINSIIVFQHIPPSRGYVLIERLWSRLRKRGCLSLHITIYHDNTHVGELIRDAGIYNFDGRRALLYARPPSAEETGMSMYDYDLNRVLAILNLSEGQELYLQHVNHAGCHGVMIYVQKQ
jgi:SAM-dependent methyltransferase